MDARRDLPAVGTANDMGDDTPLQGEYPDVVTVVPLEMPIDAFRYNQSNRTGFPRSRYAPSIGEVSQMELCHARRRADDDCQHQQRQCV